MIIQIQSKFFSLVLVIGKQEPEHDSPQRERPVTEQTSRPIGDSAARKPLITGLVK